MKVDGYEHAKRRRCALWIACVWAMLTVTMGCSSGTAEGLGGMGESAGGMGGIGGGGHTRPNEAARERATGFDEALAVAPPSTAIACTKNSDCATGYCADGVCCDTACDNLCMACTASKKGGGVDGVCGSVAYDSDPDNDCPDGACDGKNVCKRYNGASCTSTAQCLSKYCVDGYCCGNICMGACQACSTAKKGSGYNGVCGNIAAVSDPDNECNPGECNGSGACSATQTKSPNGTACTSAAQCTSGYCADGVCCDNWCLGTCQACTAAKKGQGSDGTCGNIKYDTDPDEECWGGSCDGTGTCKQYNGVWCSTASQCLSNYCIDGFCCGNVCNSPCQACSATKKGQGYDGVCGPIVTTKDPDNECNPGECNGSGACNQSQTPQANGTACTNPWQCASGFCADGVCCNAACTGSCQACTATKKGSGTNGTCGNIKYDTDPDDECYGGGCSGNGTCAQYNGLSCTTAAQCLSNYCVDGFCCNNTCAGSCYACSAAKKGQGSDGACGVIATTKDPDNECNPGECNGAGACNQSQTPQANGAACVVAAQCVSGFCVDGVCCENACTSSCQACSAAKKGSGTNGTCGNIKYDTDPDNECAGGSCSGTGTCQQYNGFSCASSANCLSNYCVDGVCCGNICTNKCYACTAAKKGSGPDGQCGPVATNTDPDDDCALTCNGAGGCVKAPNGSSCTVAADCVSGNCVDGFCCDTACTGTCQACSAMKKGGGGNGECGPVANDSDPENECPLGKCNGSGVCTVLLANGAACSDNAQCASEQCIDGVCCNTECKGMCLACNVAGSMGTCTPIASGQSDPNGTPSCTNICDGNGGCVKNNGQACVTGSECIGRVCNGLVCETAQPPNDLLVWRTIWNLPPYWSGPYPTMNFKKLVATDEGSTMIDGDTPCVDQTPCVLTGGFSPSGVPYPDHWDGSYGTYHYFWQVLYKTGPYGASAFYQKVTQFSCSGDFGDGYSTYMTGNRAGQFLRIGQTCDIFGNGTNFGDGVYTSGPVLVRHKASGPPQVTGIPSNITSPMAYGPSYEVYSIALGGGLTIYKSPAGGGATTVKSVPGSIGSRGFDVDAAGNLIIAFSFTGSVNFGAGVMTASGTDLGLVKLDPNGNVVWQKRYGGSFVQVDRVVAGENGFGVISSGTVNLGYGTATNSFVARFDTAGTALWHANPSGYQDTNNSGAAFGGWANSTLIAVEKYNRCSGGAKCKTEGAACTANDQCGSGFCVDGVCCDGSCTTSCNACTAALKGYGVDGICQAIATGTDPEDECPNGACMGMYGACGSNDGVECAQNWDCFSGFCGDGVCCNEQCSGICRSCLAAKTGIGVDGQCGDILTGTDPDGECFGGSCNGSGICAMAGNGAPCTTGSQCASTFCTDGVCCDAACSGVCEACKASIKGNGVNGVCGPIANYSDPIDECANGYCNGNGGCIGYAGASCTTSSQCVSGYCADNVCCNSACGGTCQSCLGAQTGSAYDGTCSAITAGTDPGAECAGSSCNGYGSCITPLGGSCTSALQCASGFCRDGVCCDAMCTGACQACTAAKKGNGTDGTCGVIAAGVDPDEECVGSVCNGIGTCDPIVCMADGDCPTGLCSNGYCTHKIEQISGNGYVTCARFFSGKLKCWGYRGEHGLEDTTPRGTSAGDMGANLPFINLGTGRTAKKITGNNNLSCALLDTDDVACWGYSSTGALGRGDTNTLVGDEFGEMGDNLVWVNLGTGKKAVQIATGGFHACALLNDGSVKCWGQNDSGELGYGDTMKRGHIAAQMGDALPTVALGTGKTAVELAAARDTTCAILNDGSVKCWGSSVYGKLGLGNSGYLGDGPGEMGDNLPTVNLGTGKTALQISGRSFHFCAVLNDHSVKCWGYNYEGALGVGDTVNRGDQNGQMGDNLPTVSLGTGKTAVKVAVGDWSTCALLNDGSVKCWGSNYWGQLGLGLPGSTKMGDSPGELGDNLPAVNIGTGKTAVDLAVGGYYACVILNDNGVRCWGGNGRGELGIGAYGDLGTNSSDMGDNLPAVILQ